MKISIDKKKILERDFTVDLFLFWNISVLYHLWWCYIHTEVGLDPVYIKNMLTECEYDFSYMQLLRNNNFHGSSFVDGG